MCYGACLRKTPDLRPNIRTLRCLLDMCMVIACLLPWRGRLGRRFSLVDSQKFFNFLFSLFYVAYAPGTSAPTGVQSGTGWGGLAGNGLQFAPATPALNSELMGRGLLLFNIFLPIDSLPSWSQLKSRRLNEMIDI